MNNVEKLLSESFERLKKIPMEGFGYFLGLTAFFQIVIVFLLSDAIFSQILQNPDFAEAKGFFAWLPLSILLSAALVFIAYGIEVVSAKVSSNLNMDIADKITSGKGPSLKISARVAAGYITVMASLMFYSAKYDKKRSQDELLCRGLLEETY